jgi:hypothetical protein
MELIRSTSAPGKVFSIPKMIPILFMNFSGWNPASARQDRDEILNY